MKSWLLPLFIVLAGCQQTGENKQAKSSDTVEPKTEAVDVTPKASVTPITEEEKENAWQLAEVRYIALEGGFFGLITESGEKLLPMNLQKSFRQHGATIRFMGKKQKDVVTFQQWGTPFKLSDVELISEGKSKEQLEH